MTPTAAYARLDALLGLPRYRLFRARWSHESADELRDLYRPDWPPE